MRSRSRKKGASDRPTVYDVAARAGVSIATVSFAFRQPEKVRDTTRETVLEAARELGYVPSAAARGLAHGSTGTFGMYSFDLLLAAPQVDTARRGATGATATAFHPEPADDDGDGGDPRIFPLYVDEVQRGFELECRSLGRALLLGREAGSDSSIIDIAGRVDGLLIMTGYQGTEIARIAQRIPVVGVSMASGTDPIHHVRVDNRGGLHAVVDHLVQEHGIRDIGFVGSLATHDYAERYAGYHAALLRHGITPPPAPVDQTDLDKPDHFAELRRLIEDDTLPRALVCSSDQLALAVLDLLAAHDVPVPGRVAVTGFDGILAGRLTTPTLTTVRQPMRALGRTAAQILARHVDTPGGEPETHELPVRLVTRESCGCVPVPAT